MSLKNKEQSQKGTLLIVANVDWIFILHRMAIALEAIEKGYNVVVLAKDSGRADEIRAKGITFVNLEITRSGTSPLQELQAIYNMFKIYRKLNPVLVYQVTMKPVIYGTLISKFLKIPTVNGISGLGYNFTGQRRGFVQNTMVRLMRFAFNKHNNHLVFENKDDWQELQALKVFSKTTASTIVKGVGVNLKFFSVTPQKNTEKTVILLPTRMLWDKGVREFIEAAILLRAKHEGKVFFKLCGMEDTGNLQAVPASYLYQNRIEGFLEWFGFQEDMVTEYRQADIVVLPSYREGMPTSLIEACAASLPIVTTDVIGCKECVEEGKNGYKVPVKSIKELATAMEKLILSKEDRIQMGAYSRKKAEREFDQKEVVAKHMEIFQQLLGD